MQCEEDSQVNECPLTKDAMTKEIVLFDFFSVQGSISLLQENRRLPT